MNAWKWMIMAMCCSLLCLGILISCDEEEDDDDDDDDAVPADDDSAAEDDDDATVDDDADEDDDAADDDSGGSTGSCCSCAEGYAPAPVGEEARLLVLRARRLLTENPELRQTAEDLLFAQNLIRHVPKDYKPLVLEALKPVETDIEPKEGDAAFARLYECGFSLEDADGFSMSLEEAMIDNSGCVSGCFGIDRAASCEDLAECVSLCLND